MKKRFLSVVIMMMLIFAVGGMYVVSCPIAAHADKIIWSAEGLKNKCKNNGEEQVVYELTNGYITAGSGEIEKAINSGCMTSYVDTFKAYGLISPEFVPSVSTATNSTKTETPKAPTLTEVDPVPYVTVKETTLLDGYDNGKKTGETIASDTDVTINGYSSNGYYRLESGNYVSKSDVVSKEDYDAAWTVLEEIPATCSKNGSVKKNNSLTGKEIEETIDMLEHDYSIVDEAECTCTEKGYTTYECKLCGDTYTEEYEAWGHEAGAPVVTVEPGTFSKGTMTTYCTICGEELSEESIPQTFPIPLWGVIVIAVVVVSCITGGTVLIIKRRK